MMRTMMAAARWNRLDDYRQEDSMVMDDQGEAHITFSTLCQLVVEGACRLVHMTFGQ
jgi:hypothetical protein